MKKKHWSVWLACIVLTGLLLALSVAYWNYGPGSLRWKFGYVHLGMSEQEVEAIMGPPTVEVDPATISPIPGISPDELASFKRWQENTALIKRWHGMEDDVLYGHFDKAGRLIHKFSRNLRKEKEL